MSFRIEADLLSCANIINRILQAPARPTFVDYAQENQRISPNVAVILLRTVVVIYALKYKKEANLNILTRKPCSLQPE